MTRVQERRIREIISGIEAAFARASSIDGVPLASQRSRKPQAGFAGSACLRCTACTGSSSTSMSIENDSRTHRRAADVHGLLQI